VVLSFIVDVGRRLLFLVPTTCGWNNIEFVTPCNSFVTIFLKKLGLRDATHNR
jgi:hypothetical protein